MPAASNTGRSHAGSAAVPAAAMPAAPNAGGQARRAPAIYGSTGFDDRLGIIAARP
jgi:hypothetical protein